jgi:DNA-binding transcriptional LysR family regulator
MNGGLYPHVYKIWLFSRVAEHRSFKRAAADASITLSALSQSIASLERLLGKTLLVRARSAKFALTRDGEDLLERATPIIAAIAELGQVNNGSAPVKRSKLRIGVYEAIAVNHLPHILPKLQRDFPHLAFHVWTARSAVLERHLRNGDLDAVVVARDPGIRDANADVLAKGELAFFVSALDNETSWDVLARKGVAMFAPNQDGYPAYQRRFLESYEPFFRATGIKLQVGMTSDSLEAIRRAVGIGLLAAVLPVRAARRFPTEVIALKPPASFNVDRGVHEHCLLTLDSVDPTLRGFLKRELTTVLRTVD